VLAVPHLISVYNTHLFTEILIYVIFALSLNLLMGYTGLASLGHAAFWGGGGYTIALLMVTEGLAISSCAWGSPWRVSAVLGLIFGYLALRTTGVYFVMITLALGQMLWPLPGGGTPSSEGATAYTG